MVARRALALWYGSAAALTLDQFALWLHLGKSYKPRNDYWNREGRKSIWAVWLFGFLLLLPAILNASKAKLEEPSEVSATGQIPHP